MFEQKPWKRYAKNVNENFKTQFLIKVSGLAWNWPRIRNQDPR